MSDLNIEELSRLFYTCFDQGEYLRAIDYAQQLELSARQDTNIRLELQAIEQQTLCWVNIGELRNGLEAITRCLAKARQAQDHYYQMAATLRFAEAIGGAEFEDSGIDLRNRNRWKEIKPLLLEGLSIARQLDSGFYEVYYLKQLGNYACRVGEDEQGYAWLQEALNIADSAGDRSSYFRCCSYASISIIMRNRKDYEEAVRYAEMAIGEAQKRKRDDLIARAELTRACRI